MYCRPHPQRRSEAAERRRGDPNNKDSVDGYVWPYVCAFLAFDQAQSPSSHESRPKHSPLPGRSRDTRPPGRVSITHARRNRFTTLPNRSNASEQVRSKRAITNPVSGVARKKRAGSSIHQHSPKRAIRLGNLPALPNLTISLSLSLSLSSQISAENSRPVKRTAPPNAEQATSPSPSTDIPCPLGRARPAPSHFISYSIVASDHDAYPPSRSNRWQRKRERSSAVNSLFYRGMNNNNVAFSPIAQRRAWCLPSPHACNPSPWSTRKRPNRPQPRVCFVSPLFFSFSLTPEKRRVRCSAI